MPFAVNQGVRIHYETAGEGPPLVMQYGQYFPLDIWYEHRYVDALRSDFQLILVDARGHGDSDKPYDPSAYRMEAMASDILSVLDALGLDKAHYMGYSSGGYLGFVLAKQAQDRLLSLILGGAEPYPGPDLDAELVWHADRARLLEQQTTPDFVAGLEGFLSSQRFPPLSSRLRSGLLKHDTRALAAWHRAVVQDITKCDDILGAIAVPCLLYAGEKSSEYANARRAAQEIPDAAFVGIPDGGHLEGGTWIDILQPSIIQLVKDSGD